MRFHVFASDFDGTLAHHGAVTPGVLDKLRALKSSGRTLVLVTGREMPDLKKTFPEYAIFDHIVAENGALIYTPATDKEELLGAAPDETFVSALRAAGVHPLSVGKVIVATWEPYQNTVLDVIRKSGMERQVIFNKGAVMILPPGINKATGLQALLGQLHFSEHNVVAVGDAENDSAMMLVAEFAVAVNNALPSLKEAADFVTDGDHGQGVVELADMLLGDDLCSVTRSQRRRDISLGLKADGKDYSIVPYRRGILLTGSSGGGKSTLTVSITESLARNAYQYCLIDPEGDYLELPDAVIIGNDKSVPELKEIAELLKNARQHVVICIMSIPLQDRPSFFLNLLPVLIQSRETYGHPHWILIDEAHHLVPRSTVSPLFESLDNFILIGYDVGAIETELVKRTSTVMIVGDRIREPLEQYCAIVSCPVPPGTGRVRVGEVFVFDQGSKGPPAVVTYHTPKNVQQRHKRKYAYGEMGDNNFVFTGSEGKLSLKANNLAMFVHIAEGIDDDTWMYHLKRKDFGDWFSAFLHDDELARVAAQAESRNAADSKKMILDYVTKRYLA